MSLQYVTKLQVLTQDTEAFVSPEPLQLGWMLAAVHAGRESATFEAVSTKIVRLKTGCIGAAFDDRRNGPRRDRLQTYLRRGWGLSSEIASLMIADRMGIGHDPGHHAAYVGGWIKALKEGPREIFRAAADAEKIASYLTALQQQKAVQGAAADARHSDVSGRGYWQKAIESGRQLQATEAAARPEAERFAHEGRWAGASR